MSGSSEKSNELGSRNSSKTEADSKNLVTGNSGQNYTVSKKNEWRELSSNVRIESENLSNYRDRKARGEGSGTRDYAKNLETIKNKLKLFDITQRRPAVCSKNDVQYQCSSSSFTHASPRTVGLHISAPTSTKKIVSNTICNKEKKADAEITFSNSLSSYSSSPKNDKLVSHKQLSGGSSSSAKIVNIYSPRKNMFFTSSSVSNSSSNSGYYSHFDKGFRRKIVHTNILSKQLSQHPKKKATSSESTSDSPRNSRLDELSKPKKRTRRTIKKSVPSIAEVLNKVYRPKLEHPSKQSKKVVSDNASISTSITDEDEVIGRKLPNALQATDSQNMISHLKTTCESPKSFTSRKENVGLPGTEASSSQKCTWKISNKQSEDRPITRRREQDSSFNGTSKSLSIKPTECKTRSQVPKMSQSALSKNESLKIRSNSTIKSESPINVKKHVKAMRKSDYITKLTTEESNSSSNYAKPELRKIRVQSDIAVKSPFFQKIKKSDDRIQSNHVKSKVLEKTEDLTLTAMICSPKEEIPPAETESVTSPQLTTISPTITEGKSDKIVPYKFPFPSTIIPMAFTLQGLSCDEVQNTLNESKTKNKSATSPLSPLSNFNELKVYSIHLDLPNVFHSEKGSRSSYLNSHLKMRDRKHNYIKAKTAGSSTNRRGNSHTKSLEFTVGPKKMTSTQKNEGLSRKCKSLSGGSKQTNLKTNFLNLTYSELSTSQSETHYSETLSCPIPSKRICIREDSDYDIFQIIIENDDSSSIASTCTSPPKKICIRDKTPEMSDDVKTYSKDYHSDISRTPSEKDSLKSAPSDDDFKNTILSMLLDWREKEIDKINVEQQKKDKNIISWVNETGNKEFNQSKSITPESGPKDITVINEKYKTEPFTEPESQEDVDFYADFDDEICGQQLAVISEETRVVSEEDICHRSINSTDDDLTLKLPFEPEVSVIGSLQPCSSRRSCDGRNNSLREKQDATTSVHYLRLPMENKETSASNESFLKDVGQQCELKEVEFCDIGVTASEATTRVQATTSVQDLRFPRENKETSTSSESFLKDAGQQYELKESELCDKGVNASEAFRTTSDQKAEAYDKSSCVCSCSLMPLLKRSVFEAYQVPYGEGDPIVTLIELKDDNAIEVNHQKITQNVCFMETNILNVHDKDDNVRSISDKEDYSDGDDNAMISLNPSLTVSLDVPKKFLRLYDFPVITKITTIAGNFESCVTLWEKKDIVLTETSGSRLSSPRGHSNSSTRKYKDVSWEDNLIPEKKLPKLADDLDEKLFTVLYRSRNCATHSPDKSTSSICRCQSERGFTETSQSQDEDDTQCGCFGCFRHLFGKRKKRFFDSHS